MTQKNCIKTNCVDFIPPERAGRQKPRRHVQNGALQMKPLISRLWAWAHTSSGDAVISWFIISAALILARHLLWLAWAAGFGG